MMIYANKERIPGIIAERKHRLEELARPEVWTRYTKNMECGEYKEFKQSCIDDEIIIAVLEKQVPKRPDFEGDGYDENGYLIYDTWICPCCEEKYEVDYDDYKHCPSCGQSIDWSDTE